MARSKPYLTLNFWISDTALLIYLALIKFILHLLTINRYGFHRDEFYYIANYQHFDWGYVDHPPLIVIMTYLGTRIFGENLLGLRFFGALASAIIVFMIGMLAKRLGGGRFAQILAGTAALLSPAYFLGGTLVNTTVFDVLVWITGTYVLVVLIQTQNPRWWLLFGVVIGIGLLTKYTVVFYGLGVFIGLLFTPLRQYFHSRWLWMAGGLALIIFLPNLLWQARHDFPSLEFSRDSNANYREENSLLDFVAAQIFFIGPIQMLVCGFGLYFYFSANGKAYRALGWIFLVVLISIAVIGGKPYYPVAAYAFPLAGGALMLEKISAKHRVWQPILLGAVVLISVPLAPVAAPILPLDQMLDLKLYEVNGEFGEMIGWEELAATVAQVYEELPPEEQANTLIFTGNYGEAGAINFYRKDYRLPEAVSAHNNHYLWGAGSPAETYIVVGYERRFLMRYCDSITQAAVITNSYNIENDEYHNQVLICRGLDLKKQWSKLKHFD